MHAHSTAALLLTVWPSQVAHNVFVHLAWQWGAAEHHSMRQEMIKDRRKFCSFLDRVQGLAQNFACTLVDGWPFWQVRIWHKHHALISSWTSGCAGTQQIKQRAEMSTCLKSCKSSATSKSGASRGNSSYSEASPGVQVGLWM